MAEPAHPRTVISASSSCQSAFLNFSIQRTPLHRRLIEDETSIEILKAFGNAGRTLKKKEPEGCEYCVRKEESFRPDWSVPMNWKVVVTLAAISLILCSASWAADEGAALYKSKCSGCHGATGEGKPAMKAPALKGTSLDASQIIEHITKGEATSKPPHNKGIGGVTEEQAKSIADHIKNLK